MLGLGVGAESSFKENVERHGRTEWGFLSKMSTRKVIPSGVTQALGHCIHGSIGQLTLKLAAELDLSIHRVPVLQRSRRQGLESDGGSNQGFRKLLRIGSVCLG